MCDAADGRKRKIIGALVLVARSAALLYVLVCIGLFLGQRRIIFPGAQTQGTASANVQAPPGTEMLRLETPQGQIVALFGHALDANGRPRSDAATRPTVIFFYGNAMCLADSLDDLDHFRRLGANVLIPEYLGYGMSGGTAGEAGCLATGEAAYDYVRSRRALARSPLVVSGWSLGSGPAVDLASRKPVAGLMLFSAFTSLTDIGRGHFPILPVSLMLQHRFENVEKIRRVRCPILLAHGDQDEVVPFRMRDQLAKAAGGPVECITVIGAHHNDILDTGGDMLDARVGEFLGRTVALQ